jgi:tRNA threonylcarbamoyladenosine biosynthesis protein TsaB
MTILALETGTRTGSAALVRDGAVLAVIEGDPARTHGERLPADLLRLLAAERACLADVDLLAVSSGPGSFTSVRVGVATIQALALVHKCPVVPVSTLDAVARELSAATAGTDLLASWMDGQRGEVFAALYARAPDGELPLLAPAAGTADGVLDSWEDRLRGRTIAFGGDGVASTRSLLDARLGSRATLSDRLPPLAPVLARLAAERAGRGETVTPHAIQPVYVRRPDAEIARARARDRRGAREPRAARRFSP